jgi:hypothetical protein
MNDATGDVAKLIRTALGGDTPGLSLFSGPISKLVAAPIARAFKNQGGELGKLFSPYAKNGALCAPVVGVVPVEADVKGYRLLGGLSEDSLGRCNSALDCPPGWSKFQTAPIEIKNDSMRTFSTVFMNWDSERGRVAEMIIFYTLPKGKKPLTEI